MVRATMSVVAVAALMTLAFTPLAAQADSAPVLGSIAGTVVAAASGSPLPSAVVVISGTELSAQTDSAGRFDVQGVNPGSITIVVGAAGYRPVSFSFALGDGRAINIASPIALVELPPRTADELVIREGADRGQPGFGTIGGTIVVDGAETPLRAALVQVPGASSADVTDGTGRFFLTGLGEGPHRLVVRRIGYEPVEVDVQMANGAQLEIVTPIGLVLQTPELAELVSEAANPVPPKLAGFYERQRKSFGHFITPADIARRHPFRTTELLENTPGIVISQGGIDERVVTMRSGTVNFLPGRGPMDRCLPAYFLDGVNIPIDDVDREIQVQQIQAIEVYNSATTTPSEFRKPNFSCGVIVIWTR